MSQARKLILVSVSSLLVLFSVFVFTGIFSVERVKGSAPAGLPASVSTSTRKTVSTTPSQVLATSTLCTSRVISTASSSVMITFADVGNMLPSAATGAWQAASTTQVYDSGLFGCGSMRIYSFSAQQITVLEMN